MFCCSTLTAFCDDKLMFACWEALTGFCCRAPTATCCNEFSAFPCPESKLALDCSEFIIFCCAFGRPDKEDIELCCKLDALFCWIVATEPCKFICCN